MQKAYEPVPTKVGVKELKKWFEGEQDRLKGNNVAAVAKAPTSLRVCTFNIYQWFNRNRENLSTVFEELNADIIGVQEDKQFEACDGVRAICKAYPVNNREFIGSQKLTRQGFWNTIYTRHEIVSNKLFELNHEYELRTAISCIIRLKDEKTLVHVWNMHLDAISINDKWREAETDIFLGVYNNFKNNPSDDHERLANQCAITAVIGDFNSLRRDDYTDEWWARIEEHDAWRGLKARGENVTVRFDNAGLEDSFKRANQTPPEVSTWSGRRIDHIRIPKDQPVKVVKCGVYHTNVSDHVPVFCDFDLSSLAGKADEEAEEGKDQGGEAPVAE